MDNKGFFSCFTEKKAEVTRPWGANLIRLLCKGKCLTCFFFTLVPWFFFHLNLIAHRHCFKRVKETAKEKLSAPLNTFFMYFEHMGSRICDFWWRASLYKAWLPPNTHVRPMDKLMKRKHCNTIKNGQAANSWALRSVLYHPWTNTTNPLMDKYIFKQTLAKNSHFGNKSYF